jgi:two-component system phosphate regulon sensor histidine kinase PhoR
MAEQSKRMQRIVDDLLTLSTLESAPSPSLDERVRVVPLLARLRADAVALSGGKHRIALDATGDFDLLGAEDEIASAFGNLVSNAIRYTPDGGEVRMSWRASDGAAEFAVEDSGVGFAPEHIPRLTERFYRVDRGRSRATGGTGLGLAIVKHILNRHQATLDIHSVPGKGSRFAVRFPARRVVPATASTTTAKGSP